MATLYEPPILEPIEAHTCVCTLFLQHCFELRIQRTEQFRSMRLSTLLRLESQRLDLRRTSYRFLHYPLGLGELCFHIGKLVGKKRVSRSLLQWFEGWVDEHELGDG